MYTVEINNLHQFVRQFHVGEVDQMFVYESQHEFHPFYEYNLYFNEHKYIGKKPFIILSFFHYHQKIEIGSSFRYFMKIVYNTYNDVIEQKLFLIDDMI